MRIPVNIALVVVGLAVGVYGTASLTGGWLGTPSWWRSPVPASKVFIRRLNGETVPPGATRSRDGREWISGGVVAAGIALAAFGAWPRRRLVTSRVA